MLAQRGTFLSGLGAAVAAVSRPAVAQPQTIRIGVGYADSMAEGVYAAKLDFFKKAGLLVEPTGFASGAQLSTAVAALKDLTEVGCRAWIDRAGVDSTKVRFVEITMGSMSAALERGTVDATFIGEPYLASAKRAGARVLGYAYGAIAPEFLLSTWFTTQDYYRRNGALGEPPS